LARENFFEEMARKSGPLFSERNLRDALVVKYNGFRGPHVAEAQFVLSITGHFGIAACSAVNITHNMREREREKEREREGLDVENWLKVEIAESRSEKDNANHKSLSLGVLSVLRVLA
jgi:hypothetical protein